MVVVDVVVETWAKNPRHGKLVENGNLNREISSFYARIRCQFPLQSLHSVKMLKMGTDPHGCRRRRRRDNRLGLTTSDKAAYYGENGWRRWRHWQWHFFCQDCHSADLSPNAADSDSLFLAVMAFASLAVVTVPHFNPLF